MWMPSTPAMASSARTPISPKCAKRLHIKFIGPKPEVIRLMGVKERARAYMREMGVPVLPGSPGVIASPEEALAMAEQIGYPVILKASAGGGGRGMRVVTGPDEMPALYAQAQSEAGAAFSSADVYLEKFIGAPRHIEFQVLADEHGNVEILGERECSIQRRHQKLLEESPSPAVTDQQRAEIGAVLRKASPRRATPTRERWNSSWTRAASSTSSRSTRACRWSIR
jgi:acetyl-CoA carboxylase biotin carboxylase subunit